MHKLVLTAVFLFSIQQVSGQNMDRADSIYQQFKNENSDTTKLRQLNIASMAKFRHDRNTAIQWAMEAVDLANKTSYPKEQALADYNLGYLLRYAGKKDSSILFLEKAEKQFNKQEDYSHLGMVYAQYAAHKHTGGDMVGSIESLERAIDNFSKARDTANISRFLGMIGAMHSAQDNFKDALKVAKRSLVLSQELNDSAAIGRAYQSLGHIYRNLGSPDIAVEYFYKAIDVNSRHGNNITRYIDYENLGKIYTEKGNFDSSLVVMQKALALLDTVQRPRYYVSLKTGLANIYLNLGRYEDAKKVLDQASRVAENLGIREMSGNIDQFYAGYYMVTNDYTNAKKYYEKAIEIKKASGYLYGLEFMYENMAEVSEKLGKYKDAYLYQKLLTEYNDSNARTSKIEAVSEAEAKFEVAKKDLTINLLEKEAEIKERKTARQRLVIFGSLFLAGAIGFIGYQKLKQNKLKQRLRMERFRNKVAADLHDDVGSTLSSIAMYSEVIKQKTKDIVPETIPMLENMSNSSKELMEAMSDIVWTINPKNNSLESLLTRIKTFTSELCEAKDVEFGYTQKGEIDTLKMNMESAQNIFLVLKEGVNNALKYSECTVLEMNVLQSKESFSFELKDNGKGFDIADKSLGNGMRTMRERMEEIGGTYAVHSSGDGTIISGTLPV